MKANLKRKSTQVGICILLVIVVLVALFLRFSSSNEIWTLVAVAGSVALIAISMLIGIRSMSLLTTLLGRSEDMVTQLERIENKASATESHLGGVLKRTTSMDTQLKRVNYRTSAVKTQLAGVDDRTTEIKNQTEDLIQTTGRVKQLYPVIHDTAGSVGKMAPVIREIATGVNEVRKQGTGAQVTSSNVSSAKKPVSATVQKKPVSFPPVVAVESSKPTFPVNAMVIADDFTASAFAYEWNQFTPTKTDWLSILDKESIDLLFVESAWVGNGGEWTYQLVGGLAPRPEIVALISECNKRGIPTVFWNKEDPPHFEEFLKTAALFDYVFTTDVNKVPDYKARLKHDRIDVLPFAAQPKIHNPARIRGVSRTNEVVFGGMYFREKYPERRQQMDYLLPAAAKFKLDIFSRQLGGDEKYQFPEPFDKAVRGSLEYPSMLTAYHAYKVVLNVNSVIDSESMCARRIFEATACGAAVVSSESPAVSAFYPDELITVVDDEKSAYQKMRILLRSNDLRDRKIHLAQRLTWEKYTYKERVRKVLQVLGMEVYVESDPMISVITPTVRPENLETIFENFAQQTYSNRELLICCHGFSADKGELERLAKIYGVRSYRVIERSKELTLADNLNAMIDMAEGEVIARMDDDDWYGPNYLLDLHNALGFSQADVVGKAASYIYFEESDMTVLTMPQMEHKYNDFVRGATIMGRKETFVKIPFPNGKRGEDSDFLAQVLESGGKIYSADRFNFSVSRLKSKESHTWNAADDLLFGTGEMKYLGRSLEQIQI